MESEDITTRVKRKDLFPDIAGVLRSMECVTTLVSSRVSISAIALSLSSNGALVNDIPYGGNQTTRAVSERFTEEALAPLPPLFRGTSAPDLRN